MDETSPREAKSLSDREPNFARQACRSRVPPDMALYLDIDGVLHHEAVMWHHRRGIFMSPSEAPGRKLFEWVGYLEEALEPFPKVSLVLSSSWCVKPGYGKTLKWLPERLRQRFIGGTYHKRIHGADPWAISAFKSMSRGEQIVADVRRRQPRDWIALDDDTVGWPPHAMHNLIECDGQRGLSCAAVRHALAKRLEAWNEQAR
ncbi:HAD domain-containing protein [Acidovorax sp. BLS4]|uniref:HAD domain-containing protein n=1 Tax=Acidovorax sp. BLS4 TaxID=3273430 RepID=UPI0029429AAC|nr:HAD domain-containing protein [Paracidovorax avenae]WOI45511.1 HAD domain-containing protein [Paracidovorax avenae]